MVKGDIEASILYLSENKDKRVKKTKVLIPFSAMIELDNINDKSKFDIEYNLQNFDLKVNSDITTAKTISADYRIETDITMFEEDTVDYVDDFYSQEKELSYDNSRINVIKKDFMINKNIEVREKLSNILEENTNVIDYSADVSSVVPIVNSNNSIHLEGNAKINMVIQNTENNEIDTKQIELLVNADVELENVSSDTKITVDVSNNGINLTQSGRNVEIDMNILAKCYIENIASINIINTIEADKLDLGNMDSLNIYIVKEGDTLWNIAKKYKTSIEKLLKANPEITDPDNIVEGQKIFVIR